MFSASWVFLLEWLLHDWFDPRSFDIAGHDHRKTWKLTSINIQDWNALTVTSLGNQHHFANTQKLQMSRHNWSPVWSTRTKHTRLSVGHRVAAKVPTSFRQKCPHAWISSLHVLFCFYVVSQSERTYSFHRFMAVEAKSSLRGAFLTFERQFWLDPLMSGSGFACFVPRVTNLGLNTN